jgi:hypothetical protein
MQIQITTNTGNQIIVRSDEDAEDTAETIKGAMRSDIPFILINSPHSVTIIGMELLKSSVIRIQP